MMNFRNQPHGAKAMMPIAMMFLVMGILWPYFFHPSTQFAQNLSHGARGILYGISFGINLIAIRLATRKRGCVNQAARDSYRFF